MTTTLWDGTIVPVAFDHYCDGCEMVTHHFDSLADDPDDVEPYRCTVCAMAPWDD